MENLYYLKRKKLNGAVLVMALLLLTVLSLLALSAMELGLMQNKMQKNLDAKIISLQNAESGLIAAETALRQGDKSKQKNERWSYTITAIALPEKTTYKIIAIGYAGVSQTVLEVRDVLESETQQDGSKIIKQTRLMWNELNNDE